MRTSSIIFGVWCAVVLGVFSAATYTGNSPFADAGRNDIHGYGYYGPMHK